jgi:1,2-diacylglycerol 3-beta-glucosyltransferase
MLVLILVFLLPATFAAGYYLVLTALGWQSRLMKTIHAPRLSFAVVIPAHNEELGLPKTLHSLLVANDGNLSITVIADNCTDGTADVATGFGVHCLVRTHATECSKGYALAWAIPQLSPADVVVILDADSEVLPDFFQQLEAKFAAGAGVVQAKVVLEKGEAGEVRLVAAVGCEIENAVSAGLERLGRTITLRGNGMAFQARVLERFPWSAFALTEDAEYSGLLERHGVRVQFASNAIVKSEIAPSLAALTLQRKRWRASLAVGGAGLLHRWLGSKPLVLLHLMATSFCLTCYGVWNQTWLLPTWSLLLVLLTFVVYWRAWRKAGVGSFLQLLPAAKLVFRLAGITLAGPFAGSTVWQRTTRTGEVTPSRSE